MCEILLCLPILPPPPFPVEAAGPEMYSEFMQVLCNYIVEKQRQVQGEELPFDLVFVSPKYEQCTHTVYMHPSAFAIWCPLLAIA